MEIIIITATIVNIETVIQIEKTRKRKMGGQYLPPCNIFLLITFYIKFMCYGCQSVIFDKFNIIYSPFYILINFAHAWNLTKIGGF